MRDLEVKSLNANIFLEFVLKNKESLYLSENALQLRLISFLYAIQNIYYDLKRVKN